MQRLALLGMGVLLTGCSYWTPDALFEQNALKEQAIVNTKKQEITIDGRRMLVLSTYLNNLDNPNVPRNDMENFIVAFYVGEEGNTDDVIQTVMLNDSEEGITWEILQPQNPLLGLLPVANSWSRYFYIKAPKNESDTLKLLIENGPSSKVVLTYQKAK